MALNTSARPTVGFGIKDSNGRTIFVADAHRSDGQRFIVRADEKLTAFVELESAISSRQSIQSNLDIGAACRSLRVKV